MDLDARVSWRDPKISFLSNNELQLEWRTLADLGLATNDDLRLAETSVFQLEVRLNTSA